jgi:hypothetical protein
MKFKILTIFLVAGVSMSLASNATWCQRYKTFYYFTSLLSNSRLERLLFADVPYSYNQKYMTRAEKTLGCSDMPKLLEGN